MHPGTSLLFLTNELTGGLRKELLAKSRDQRKELKQAVWTTTVLLGTDVEKYSGFTSRHRCTVKSSCH